MENARSGMKEPDCTGGKDSLQEELAGYGKTILASSSFDGPHVWRKSRKLPQDAQQGRRWHIIREASFGSRCRINYGMFTRYDSRFNGGKNAAWEKARLLGNEAVLAAASGWAGEVVAGI